VSANHALRSDVRLYDNLFINERPDEVEEGGGDFKSNLNPQSLEVLSNCMVEPSLKEARPLTRFQFERLGYFCVDADSTEDKLTFNRTVTLRDTWAKIQKKG
jgi:glutaminyl-tRNA synthetase